MKNVLSSLRSSAFKVLGSVALLVGIFAVTPATLWSSSQPECPKELLK